MHAVGERLAQAAEVLRLKWNDARPLFEDLSFGQRASGIKRPHLQKLPIVGNTAAIGGRK